MTDPVLMKPWSVRAVTSGEAALLAEVFGAGLDVGRVRLWSCPPLGWTVGRPFCAGGWLIPGRTLIVYPPKAALADFAAPETPLSSAGTFVHECVHAAQSQAGVCLPLAKLRAGDTVDSYRYSLSPATRWSDLNIEQQAVVVEHAFLGRRGKATLYPASLYAAVSPYPAGACTSKAPARVRPLR